MHIIWSNILNISERHHTVLCWIPLNFEFYILNIQPKIITSKVVIDYQQIYIYYTVSHCE